MKYIHKQSQPEAFLRYKRQRGASFKELSNNKNREIKNCLRESLLVEQGYICCYCGQEISSDNSVIEHLKNKDYHPNLQLEYNNLVCSCKGGQDRRARNPRYPLYCDANKGNLDISIYPIDCICESKFEFDEDGNIYGLDEAARETIKVLNLNNDKLKNQRKHAIDPYRYNDDGNTDWIDELNMIAERGFDKKFLPFCFVIHSYIKNYRLKSELESDLIFII
ncbi:hypothetical protein Amet_0851 [Alkaliphilus metalliredigens QYMF]|uniref:TIGR02646 family protein n=1 Tax=Alkaliphilus metalliredigens (strain QYMF) TaxID=293826 RepID=A6TLK8_ALKMQ|nr:retron system putative HNH endonuclease [Alkaliphilus metalliredigens]ABR47076.1 hypothetical protein Amet_0851 [Alkaliphilus metalliredigens QYMF]